MTSIQLAHRCARHLTVTDLARLPADALLDVLTAMNAAIQEVYALLPARNKQAPVTDVLRAPVTVDVTVAARYQNLFTSSVFTQRQEGCTVRVCDDTSDNQVVAVNAVLDDFMGVTLNGQATVYSDAVHCVDVIERVISVPRLFDAGGGFICELERDQNLDTRRMGLRQIGTPRTFRMEPVGSSQNAEPREFLRVHPMPDRDFKIRFDAELSPRRITFAEVSRDAVNLPIHDRLCESALVPIAAEHLITSRFWADPNSKNDVRADASRGRTLLRLMPQDTGPGRNQVGTPTGY